jgi:hypothetical protein
MATKTFKSEYQAREFLKSHGFFTDNLWHIYDVQGRFDCDEDTAKEILNEALTNPNTIEFIHETIDIICEERELNKLNK